jgi:hypothetical protein
MNWKEQQPASLMLKIREVTHAPRDPLPRFAQRRPERPIVHRPMAFSALWNARPALQGIAPDEAIDGRSRYNTLETRRPMWLANLMTPGPPDRCDRITLSHKAAAAKLKREIYPQRAPTNATTEQQWLPGVLLDSSLRRLLPFRRDLYPRVAFLPTMDFPARWTNNWELHSPQWLEPDFFRH